MSRLYYRYISINHREPPEPLETGSLCLNKHLGQYLFYFIGSVITVTFWRKTLKFTEQLSFTTSQTWSWAATMQNRTWGVWHEMAAVVRQPSCSRASNWKDWHVMKLLRTAHVCKHPRLFVYKWFVFLLLVNFLHSAPSCSNVSETGLSINIQMFTLVSRGGRCNLWLMYSQVSSSGLIYHSYQPTGRTSAGLSTSWVPRFPSSL